jgi:hypothetical protein
MFYDLEDPCQFAKEVNAILDPISNIYEETYYNRIGHNFPSEYIPNNHILSQYKNNAALLFLLLSEQCK